MSTHDQVFRKYHLFSKDDILNSVEMLIEHEKIDQDCYSEQIQRNRVKLCERFKETLSKVKLPELKDDWWYYDYQFPEVKIRLILCKADDIEIEDGEISSMTSQDERILLTVESDYLSIVEYAALMEVRPETVEKWIHKGKLRNARRIDNDWMIPDTQDRPRRKFVNVTYIVNFGEEIHSQEFPMLAAAETISIRWAENNKDSYNCTMFRFSDRFLTEIELDRSEAERLEYTIIESGKAELDTYVQYLPYIR